MLIKFYKGEPNTYTVCFRNGHVVRHGAGINFWYAPALTTIASVPLASQEANFVFTETTVDFQEVAVQGALTYSIVEPLEIASRLNFTIQPGTNRYRSRDPDNLIQRVVNAVQGHTRTQISKLPLEEALTEVKDLASEVFAAVAETPELIALGIRVEGLHFTAVSASADMQKALEADFREQLNKRADQAVYDRRKAAVEEERKIRESEMNTDVELENRRKALVDTQARNKLALAEADAKAEELRLSPYGDLPGQALVGLALRDWAANAGTIENLSITPDLLTKVVNYVSGDHASPVDG